MEVVQYIGGCSVHRGDNISTVEDSSSTVEDSSSTVEVVQYSGGKLQYCGGKLQYCGGIASVLWRLFSTVADNISTCGGITSVYAGG